MSFMPEIPAERLALLDSAILTAGSHQYFEGTCARELIHLVVTGEKQDKTPECLTRTLAVLPRLNDGPWRDDAHRTEVLLPYLRRLLQCPRDTEADFSRSYVMVDYVIRIITPQILDMREHPDVADRFRAMPPIVDASTARKCEEVFRSILGGGRLNILVNIAEDASIFAISAEDADSVGYTVAQLVCSALAAATYSILSQNGAT